MNQLLIKSKLNSNKTLTKLFHTDHRRDMKEKKKCLKIQLVIRKC